MIIGITEIILFFIGLVLGPFVNFAIYSFAYFPRQISPWQKAPASRGPYTWVARIPIVGWLSRCRETSEYGRFVWLRPFMLEVLLPMGLVLLYRFVLGGGNAPGPIPMVSLVHHFIACALLISLMTIATFIDFDERTVPDMVTVPGTWLGLIGAVVFPDWRLYEEVPPVFPALNGSILPLHADSPMAWSAGWNGGWGLFVALFIWSGWCFGIADRRWIVRRGYAKAFEYFIAGIRRSPTTPFLIGMWFIGVLGLLIASQTIGPARWEALLSSLFGIGLGGALVWGFRLVARWAMGQEALGFGDVTLMAMIGAFFGWQVVWIAFFIAPFCGMVFVLIGWLMTGDNATPFGPYLCAASLIVILAWKYFWESLFGLFFPPLEMVFFMCLLLGALGAMLYMVQTIKMKLLGDR